MKILIEGMSYNPGGLETFIMTVVRNLNPEKYHFDFLYYDQHIAYEDELKNLGCGLYKITSRRQNYNQYKKELNQLFKCGNYDVFWSNKTTLSAIEPFIAAKKNKVKQIICHSHQSKNMGTKFTYVMHQINKLRLSKYVTDYFACSDVAAKWFFRDLKSVKIINNAVDINEFDYNLELRNLVRNQLNLADNEIAIGNIARFAPEKNQSFLIDIVNELVKQEVKVKLFLCGDGSLKSQIEAKVDQLGLSKYVSFLGVRNDISKLLQAFDIFVLPSLFEGLPFVLVEAQAAGLPCLVSDNVSDQCQLSDKLQFLSLSKSKTDWAKTIVNMAQKERVSLKSEIVAKGFDINSFVARIENLLYNDKMDGSF